MTKKVESQQQMVGRFGGARRGRGKVSILLEVEGHAISYLVHSPFPYPVVESLSEGHPYLVRF